jgi:RHS repeat-associated protein
MTNNDFFSQLLGLTPPWRVTNVDADLEQGVVHVYVDHDASLGRLCCSTCGRECPGYDRQEQRQWRHLDLFQYMTYLVCSLPRVECPVDGVRPAQAPWTEPNSRFTILFEHWAITVLQAAGNLWTTSYDNAGRVIAQADPLGNRTSFLYDAGGERTMAQDANGHVSTTAYDAAGRVAAQQDARGYLTSFAYDAADQRTAIVDANGSRTTSAYDNRGSILTERDPLGVYTSYTYDAVGNRTLRVDGRNWPTTYSYDALNRVTSLVYIDGTKNSFTYDAAGQQATIQDRTGVTTYSYDNAGRQTAVAYGSNKALTYSFDASGNRTLMIDSDGGHTTYTYDMQNRLSLIINPYNEYTTHTWDALDRELLKTHANAMTVSHTYDDAGRETLLQNIGSTGIAVGIYTATYDAVGNRLSVLEFEGNSCNYSYDAVNQLTSERRTGSLAYNTTYTYDGLGNRLVKYDSGKLTTYTYNAASAQILAVPTTGLPTTTTYDSNGNVTTDQTGTTITTYTWDGDNRMTAFDIGGSVSTFAYSSDGLRRLVNGGPMTYDGQNLLLGASNQPGGVTYEHFTTDFPGYWGGVTSQRISGQMSSNFYAFDISGNARQLVNADGHTVSDVYSYKAFGEELGEVQPTANVFRWNGLWGYYRDGSDRRYVRQRWMLSSKGIWIRRDPIRFSGGANVYLYVMNNPIGRVDPSGYISFSRTTSKAGKLPPFPPGKPLPPIPKPPSGSQCDAYEIKLLCSIVEIGQASNVCETHSTAETTCFYEPASCYICASILGGSTFLKFMCDCVTTIVACNPGAISTQIG